MIITSLLDTDLYKFTMMQVVFHHFSDTHVSYQFRCRTPQVNFHPFVNEIKQALHDLCQQRLSHEELAYLQSLSFFKQDFLDYLSSFQLKASQVKINTQHEFQLTIEGTWLETILFEVPLLAIISEIYCRHRDNHDDYALGRKRLSTKITQLLEEPDADQLRFSDFGTRRRYAKAWHDEVIKTLIKPLPRQLTGTSNLYLAKKYKLKPIGTMAHEYLQACQVLAPGGPLASQPFAFKIWLQEYQDQLAIALSDVFTIDQFLKDFDIDLATQYQGARQDSGDPITWGEKLLTHYQTLGIDPKHKTLVFSDNLSFPKALAIYRHFHEKTNPVFGIGTYLTNDFGLKAPQIIIKMTHCNHKPVAKITDDPSKAVSCDESYLKQLKKLII